MLYEAFLCCPSIVLVAAMERETTTTNKWTSSDDCVVEGDAISFVGTSRLESMGNLQIIGGAGKKK
jgi:hypothetical protein